MYVADLFVFMSSFPNGAIVASGPNHAVGPIFPSSKLASLVPGFILMIVEIMALRNPSTNIVVVRILLSSEEFLDRWRLEKQAGYR